MEAHVDEDLIRQLAKKIAKDIKTEADHGDFSKLLKKIVVETALDAECQRTIEMSSPAHFRNVLLF